MMTEGKGGLEGVAVAPSSISTIDGEKGELRYRGYSIHELARDSSFVEVAYLLWHGELPTASQLEDCDQTLRDRRMLNQEVQFLLHGLATRAGPMDALRTIVSAMSAVDSSKDDIELGLDRAMRMTAQLPTVIAAYARVRANKEIVPPRPEMDHAENFLHMLHGKEPSQEEARAFDTCLTLHAEHGFNASTFSARVTASTLSDIYSAVTSAIATLKGPLHGGANTAVMNMLLELGSVEKLDAFLDKALAEKQRIMGFGHRVYKVIDPRAILLKEACELLSRLKDDPTWYRMSLKLEDEMMSRKGLYPNVDFFSASTYYYMGLPPELYTPIFAMSRITGWTAHILEQYANNRLIRPRAEYVGRGPRSYVPIDRRK
ncbi:MAG: citrate/2-methylcitrate synthase [Planctomycetota bacterium]